MRRFLLLLLLAPLSGCLIIDDEYYFDDGSYRPAPYVVPTAEPPSIAPMTMPMPVQTSEPPR